MTLIELIDRAIADPNRAVLLIAIICCTLVSFWPIIIFVTLVAMKLSALKLIFATLGSTFCSGSVITFTVIKVKKVRKKKDLRSGAADGAQLTKGNSRQRNPKPNRKRRKPRRPRSTK